MIKKLWTILTLCLIPLWGLSATLIPLPEDLAFQLSAQANDHQAIVLHWNIASGYYLYRSEFSITAKNKQTTTLGTIVMPPANTIHKTPVGQFPVYLDSLTLTVPILKAKQKQLSLNVHYQGCSSAGFCYPPIDKIISIQLPDKKPVSHTATTAKIKPDLTTSISHSKADYIRQLLTHSSISWIILAFFGFGLLISLTPCVLPMIPILSSIIVGHSKKGQLNHRRSFCLALAYVLGMAITYAIAGMIFGFLGSNIQTLLQIPWVITTFALLFVLLALSMFGYFELQLPTALQNKLQKTSGHQHAGSYIGVALMGMISSLIMSPCVTPPLVGALGFISHTGNALLGAAALFALGFGMGVPLLVIGASSAKLLPKSGPWMTAINKTIGVTLLAVAITLIARIIPAWGDVILWALLALGCSVSLGSFRSTVGILGYIKKSVGIILFIYGIILLINLIQGNSDPFQPFTQQTSRQKQPLKFIPVKAIADVQQQLQQAHQTQQPTMLDFTAQWCIACKEMDEFTFSDPSVQHALKPFRQLRADVSNNDSIDKKLEKHYSVIAPPTIIFFNAHGQEIQSARIVGNISAEKFYQHIKAIHR